MSRGRKEFKEYLIYKQYCIRFLKENHAYNEMAKALVKSSAFYHINANTLSSIRREYGNIFGSIGTYLYWCFINKHFNFISYYTNMFGYTMANSNQDKRYIFLNKIGQEFLTKSYIFKYKTYKDL